MSWYVDWRVDKHESESEEQVKTDKMKRIEHLHKSITYFESIGSWGMAEIMRKWLQNEI